MFQKHRDSFWLINPEGWEWNSETDEPLLDFATISFDPQSKLKGSLAEKQSASVTESPVTKATWFAAPVTESTIHNLATS